MDTPSPSFPSLRASPWTALARDSLAEAWRERHKRLIEAIGATLGDSSPDINTIEYGPSYAGALSYSESALYSLDGGDPTDRTALIDWMAEAACAADTCPDGDGRGLPHIWIGHTMGRWSAVAWGGVQRPAWAEPLFDELRTVMSYDEDTPENIAIREDFRVFLEAHRRHSTSRPSGNLRKTTALWNREAANACCAWMLLAHEAPERVPKAMMDDLDAFRGRYEVNPCVPETQSRVMALWERKVLEEFVKTVPPHPGEGTPEVRRARTRKL